VDADLEDLGCDQRHAWSRGDDAGQRAAALSGVAPGGAVAAGNGAKVAAAGARGDATPSVSAASRKGGKTLRARSVRSCTD